MLDNNTVYFLNIIWTYCTCMYYVSEINEYYYIIKYVSLHVYPVLMKELFIMLSVTFTDSL